MKTLLAAAVSAVLLASGTAAFAETTSATAPKIEQKAQVGATMEKSKAPATNVSVESKATKVEEKGKVADHAKAKADSAKINAKADAKAKVEAPVKK